MKHGRGRVLFAIGLAVDWTASGHDASDHGPPKAFIPNCAALKICNLPIEDRDPRIHLVNDGSPKGHLRPVGHADFSDSWAGEIEAVAPSNPTEFWTKHWPNHPFVSRGFARDSPAHQKWNNESYLLEHFGEQQVRCEPKNEDRLRKRCGKWLLDTLIRCDRNYDVPQWEVHLKLSEALPFTRNLEYDLKIVTQLPVVMGHDFLVPSFASCSRRHSADPGPASGRWLAQVHEFVLRLSHDEGRNFSSNVMSYSTEHQVVCVLDGSQEWITWDLATEVQKIQLWSHNDHGQGNYDDSTHRSFLPDDSPIDPEHVDLEQTPEFASARWRNVTLEAGDCLYVPALLLHYVRSHGRALSVTTTFEQEEHHDPECAGEVPGEPQTAAAYDVTWPFPGEDASQLGYGIAKFAHPSWKRKYLRLLVGRAARREGGLSEKEFVKEVKAFAKDAAGLSDVKRRAKAAFAAMASASAGAVGPEQLYRSRELRHLLQDIVVATEGKIKIGTSADKATPAKSVEL